jgi:hypothetical protein
VVTYNFKVTDGTSEVSNTATITIDGKNDQPSVTTGTVTVSDEGLTNANTEVDSQSATASLAFSVSDDDLSDTHTVTLSEPATTYASGGNNLSWTGDGTQGLVGYYMDGGQQVDVITIAIVSGEYKVEQYQPIDHIGSGEDTASISIGVTVTDNSGSANASNSTATLTVNVEDDSPVDDVDELATPSVDNLVGENTIGELFNTGADGFGSVSLNMVTPTVFSGGELVSTSQIGNTLYGIIPDGAGGTENVFSVEAVVDDATGEVDYEFTLLAPLELASGVDFDLTNAPAGNNETYKLLNDGTIESHAYSGTDFIAEISATGTQGKINSNNSGIGVDDQTSIDAGETMTFTYNVNGSVGVPATKLTFATGNNQSAGTSVIGFIVTLKSGDTFSVPDLTVTNTGEIELHAPPGDAIQSVTISHVSGDDFQVTGLSSDIFDTQEPADIEFSYTATDADGDAVVFDSETGDGHFSITVGPVDAPPPLPAPPAADNAQTATDGADTLLGTEGADVFEWNLADNNAEGDTVTNFEDGDALDLRDLLVGEDGSGGDAGNLTEFLSVTSDGTDTVIEVSSNGGFAGGYDSNAVDQIITLEGVDLVSGQDQNSVIQGLLDAGKLITD